MLRTVASRVAAASAAVGVVAQNHCQVPCGIFDDPARITTLREVR